MDDFIAPSKTSRQKVPISSTLLLINNFVANTIVFLNSFADNCEKRICKVSNNITKLEILLAVLEAKLNSIPGLEYSSSDLPSTEVPAVPIPAEPVPPSDIPSQTTQPTLQTPPPPPPPAMNIAPTVVQEEVQDKEEAPSIDVSGMIAVSNHPDYIPFFKMAKVGVPQIVIQGKMGSLGLDGSLLDEPDKLIPAP